MTNRKDIEQLYLQHYRKMYRLASMLLHDDADSKDVVNDIFTGILDGHIVLKDNPSEGFFLVCVRNECLNRLRNQQLHRRLERLLPLDGDESLPSALEAKCQLLRQGVERALPDRQREVVLMRFDEGLALQAIGDRLGVSKVAVFKQLKAAMISLRTYLKENE